MALPQAVEALWNELQAARVEVLKEVEGLSQAQADWKPGDKDWSIGLVLDHLRLAEIASGKLTTKLTREAEAAGRLLPYPSGAAVPDFIRLPSPIVSGPVEAPPHIWPQGPRPIGDLLAELRCTRERSRLSIDQRGRSPAGRAPARPRTGFMFPRLQGRDDRFPDSSFLTSQRRSTIRPTKTRMQRFKPLETRIESQ